MPVNFWIERKILPTTVVYRFTEEGVILSFFPAFFYINISAVVVALVKILAVTSMNISNTHMGFRS